MRVISGKFKYKQLFSPDGKTVRPTTDRIKETLFNILAAKGKVGDVLALDLFSGSGALGIESLSRGASKVIFVDKSKEGFRLTNQNLKHVGADPASFETYSVDYEFALKKLKNKNFDLILVDPPYGLRIENKILDLIKRYNVLAADGVIMVEHDANNTFEDEDFDFDSRDCGQTILSFLTRKGGENA